MSNYIEQHPYTNKIKKLNDYLIEEDKKLKYTQYGSRAGPYILFKILIDNNFNEQYLNFDTEKQGGTLYKDLEYKNIQSAKELSEYKFDYDENVAFDKENVLILGGGPIGLAMAVQLKSYIPELEVKVIEKRSKGNKRKLERQQLILLNNFILLNNYSFILEGENLPKINEIEKKIKLLDNNFKIDKYDKNNYFYSLPNEFIRGDDEINDAISINMIEFLLSKKAKELGVLIVNSNIDEIDSINEFTTDKTLAIFDATGARLPFNPAYWENLNPPQRYCKCIMGNINNFKDQNRKSQQQKEYYFLSNKTDFYLCNCSDSKDIYNSTQLENEVNDITQISTSTFEFQVKGYNKNHTNIINDIPLISIGDSMRSGDFTTGTGIQFGLMHNLICALIFKKYYDFISGNVGISPSTEKEIIISNGDTPLSENVQLILKHFGIPNPHFPLLKPEIVSTGGKNKKRKTKKLKKSNE